MKMHVLNSHPPNNPPGQLDDLPLTPAPSLLEEDLKVLESEYQPEEPCLETIRSLAASGDTEARDRLEKKSRADFCNFPVIRRLRCMAKKFLAIAELRIDSARWHHSDLTKKLKNENRYDWVMRDRGVNLKQLSTIPQAVRIVFWSVLLVLALAWESSTAVYLLRETGLFDGLWFALSFSAPFVCGSFVLLCFLQSRLTNEGRRRLDQAILFIAAPLSLGSIVLFALVIGGMHGDANLFPEAGQDATDGIGFRLLLAVGMVSFAITIKCIASLLSSCLWNIVEQVPTNNKFFAVTASDQSVSESRLGEWLGLREVCLDVLNLISVNEDAYAEANLIELERQRTLQRAHQAEANLKFIDAA